MELEDLVDGLDELVRDLFDESQIQPHNIAGSTAYTSSGTTSGGCSISASTPAQGTITISSSGATSAVNTPGGPNNITSGTTSIPGTYIGWPGSAGGTGGSSQPWVINAPYNTPINNGGWVSTPAMPITVPGTGGTWGTGTWISPGIEYWPYVKDGIGIVFVDGELIKMKTKNGKEVIIGKLGESYEEVIPLEVIIAKKRLLEGTKEESQT